MLFRLQIVAIMLKLEFIDSNEVSTKPFQFYQFRKITGIARLKIQWKSALNPFIVKEKFRRLC